MPMAFLGDLVRNHGWHVVAELGALVLIAIFSALYLTGLVRGRVRAVACPTCGRVASRAHSVCPRCKTPLDG